MISIKPNRKNQSQLNLSRLSDEQIALQISKLNLFYANKQAISDLSMSIPKYQVTAFIGPSGCGKSSLLRCINRMTDLVDNCKVEGEVKLNGKNIFSKGIDVNHLRRTVGMVFQRPNPFPKSIYENVIFTQRINGIKNKRQLDLACEQALTAAALWDEVKDRLDDSAFSLSAGQQQRLVIARAIAIKPDILLLDEPTSALDPISTLTIEELISVLKSKLTVMIVTHNMQQAARVSDYTAFIDTGKLVEYADTNTLFTKPKYKTTEDYITGRYG